MKDARTLLVLLRLFSWRFIKPAGSCSRRLKVASRVESANNTRRKRPLSPFNLFFKAMRELWQSVSSVMWYTTYLKNEVVGHLVFRLTFWSKPS